MPDEVDRAERRINRRAARLEKSIRCGSIAIVVCVLVWAVAGAGYFWPGWVILGVVISLVAKTRKLHRALERGDGDGYRVL